MSATKAHPVFGVVVKIFVQKQRVVLVRGQGVVPAAGGHHAVAILFGNVQQLGFGQVVSRVHSQPPAERLAYAAPAEPEFAHLAEHAQFQQVFRRGQWDTVGSAAAAKRSV